MITPLLITAALIAAPYEIYPYSAASDDAALYLLPGGEADAANIVVLDANQLAVYPANSPNAILKHQIASDTLLFDLFDTNEDGEPELYTLHPDRIVQYPDSAKPDKTTLFPIDPALPWTVEQPFLHPMVITYNRTPLIAMPYQNQIVLRDFEGRTISSLPKTLSDTYSLFTIPVLPNQIGAPGTYEFRVDSFLTTDIQVPQEFRATQVATEVASISPRALRESEKRDLDLWPSFPLTPGPDNTERVIYASYPPEHVHTIIRIKRRRPPSAFTQSDPEFYTPERIYPGTIAISRSGLPDFNGDGFHDLVLWKMAIPGRSVSTLISNIQAQTWPVELTVHLYNPAKRLYAARPSARIQTTVNIQFILMRQSEAPLRNLSFTDLNGDGYSDISFSPEANTVATWIYGNGFREEPDYEGTFAYPVELLSINRQGARTPAHTLLLRDVTAIYRVNVPQESVVVND